MAQLPNMILVYLPIPGDLSGPSLFPVTCGYQSLPLDFWHRCQLGNGTCDAVQAWYFFCLTGALLRDPDPVLDRC